MKSRDCIASFSEINDYVFFLFFCFFLREAGPGWPTRG